MRKSTSYYMRSGLDSKALRGHVCGTAAGFDKLRPAIGHYFRIKSEQLLGVAPEDCGLSSFVIPGPVHEVSNLCQFR